MLTSEQKDEVWLVISKGLDRAEAAWGKVGSQMIRASASMEAQVLDEAFQSSNIPGHPEVGEIPEVSEFVALVVDMRNSSKRLKTKFSGSKFEHGMQRVFFETSALLPAVAKTVSFGDGVVTEYLGDGALALFNVEVGKRLDRIRRVHALAESCVGEVREMVNYQISERYKLNDPMSIGAGISVGKAMVTLVGYSDNYQPRAIGECVWEASKLSGEFNKVYLSESAKSAWPVVREGKIRFVGRQVRGVNGFALMRDD
ncbi:MAG: adenylate/guanylate cyclase [Moraxellaceae bacterium]|nr:adenylate/guanylate cyclase [Moraxellaceae bacterium]